MNLLNRLSSITPPTQQLYHYTTQHGLMGIIEKNAIWATKIQYLNDSSEFKLALKLVIDEIITRRAKSKSALKVILYNHLLEKIKFMSLLNTCVCSFSVNKDLLSQWRGYAGGIGGYAVGFNSSNLLDEAHKQRFILSPCIYNEKDQKNLLSELITDNIKYINNKMKNSDIDDYHELDSLTVNFCINLATIAPLIKHQTYSEEQEWRLISKWGISLVNLAVRPGRSTLIPYYPFKLGSSHLNYLDQIVIGPCPHPELAEDALHVLVRRINTPKSFIIRSEIPFRAM